MSLIKDALDKAVEEDKEEKSAKEHYKELEDAGEDPQPEESVDEQPPESEDETSQEPAESPEEFQIPTRYILLLTAMIVLTVVVLGQVVFLLTYFL